MENVIVLSSNIYIQYEQQTNSDQKLNALNCLSKFWFLCLERHVLSLVLVPMPVPDVAVKEVPAVLFEVYEGIAVDGRPAICGCWVGGAGAKEAETPNV